MGEASLAATMEAASLCLAMGTSKSTKVVFPSQAGATTAAPNGDTYAARQETAPCPAPHAHPPGTSPHPSHAEVTAFATALTSAALTPASESMCARPPSSSQLEVKPPRVKW